MKKIVQATEMKDADPLFVSVVGRGANRRPFQVIKEEGATMPGNTNAQQQLDLSAMLSSMKAQKQEAAKPVLQAIVVPAGQGEALKAELDANTTSGLPPVLTLKEEGGFDFLLFTETLDPDAVTYTTGDAGISVANVKKYVSTWPDSENFADNIAKSGLWSDIWGALTTADSTISIALENSNSPEEAAQKVDSIMTDLSTHLMGVVKAIPSTAYKAEKIVSTFSKALAVKADADAAAALATASAVTEPAVTTTPDATLVDPAVAPAADVTPEAPVFDQAAFMTQIGNMLDAKLQDHTAKMEARIGELTSQVTQEVETTAAKADKAMQVLAGTVVGSTATPDAPVVTTKSEPTAPEHQDSWERA